MLKKEVSTWEPGQTIYKKGDPPEFAYLIISGVIEFFTVNEVLLGQAGPDEVFGEISCYLNRTHSVTAKSKTHVVAKIIPKQDLHKIISKTHPVIMGMLRSTYHRLADSNNKSEGYVKEIDKYSLMFEKSKENSENVQNRIDTIQEKLDKINEDE
tara:strand:- start:693 stop:1157 length:465 start_codon:yes stop_codon:yes gene_type:complete